MATRCYNQWVVTNQQLGNELFIKSIIKEKPSWNIPMEWILSGTSTLRTVEISNIKKTSEEELMDQPLCQRTGNNFGHHKWFMHSSKWYRVNNKDFACGRCSQQGFS